MATPKRRKSKSRIKHRRTHLKIKPPTLTTCSNCASVKLPHSVCPNCGFYKGKPIISKT